jgi:hypothetical protein
MQVAVHSNLKIQDLKRILLYHLKEQPFFLDFNLSNDFHTVADLLRLTYKRVKNLGENQINVYLDLDTFDLTLTVNLLENSGFKEISLSGLKMDMKLLEIYN